MTTAADSPAPEVAQLFCFLQLLWSRRGCQSHLWAIGYQCKHNKLHNSARPPPPPLDSVGFRCSGFGEDAAWVTWRDSRVRIIMSWPRAVCLHCHHTSPSCHVSKVNSFVLLSRMHLRLWKKKEVGERTRRIRRQSGRGVDAKKKWWENRKEIRGGEGDDEWAKKEFIHSPFHSFISLSAGAHEVRRHEI